MKRLPQLSPDAGLPPCIDRRDFLANSGLLAVAAMLAGACGDGQLGGTPTSPVAGSDTVTIRPADYPALVNVGGIARVLNTVRPIALVRSSATTYRAFSMICTHQGTTINIVAGDRSFRCPNHGAEFSNTGQRTGGQQTANLNEVQATVDQAAGTVTVRY